MCLAAGLIATVALVDVTITGPRVAIRWSEEVDAAGRVAVERKYDLRNGERDDGTTWRYDLGNRSTANIRALIDDPAVADTGYIDRDALTTRGRDVRIAIRSFPSLSDRLDRASRLLLELNSTIWLWSAGAVLLAAARSPAERRRRRVTVTTLLLAGGFALALPISSTLVRMGDANQAVQSRGRFEEYAGANYIRFEAHLSYAILGRLDRLFGRTDTSPVRAQATLARSATVWFVLCALAIGFVERWSPHVVRYLALALLAPAALMYFGWREVGYMSLNVATFPLLARGVRDGGWRLDAGSLLAGLGAALHGWGLVSLAGAWIAALAAPATRADRVGRALRIAAWGTAAYVAWFAVYIIVLKLPITPGHAEAVPWRPWFVDGVFDARVNPAIFSATGARILLMTAWVVGAPLLVVAGSLRRHYGDEVRVALAYALPSVMITLLVWHTQGLRQDMDVVFAVFPALYALAWVCAYDRTRTIIAAAVLVSAHVAFWTIMFDPNYDSTVVR